MKSIADLRVIVERWFARGLMDEEDSVVTLGVLEHIESLHREIEELRNAGTRPGVVGLTDAELQRRADFNRDHAWELFPELWWGHESGRWHSPNDKPVVFTPYGWIEK